MGRRRILVAAGFVVLAAAGYHGVRDGGTGHAPANVVPTRPVQTTDDDTAAPPTAQQAALAAAANPLGDMAYGSPEAPVTVVEYASPTCVHCHRFLMDTFEGIKLRYIDKGLVRWVVREYATDGLATDAMMLARCVGGTPDGTRTAFEAILRAQPFFMDPLHPEANGPASLVRAVGPSLGIGRREFDACLDDRRVYDAVNATFKAGRDKLLVAETPTFFVDGEPLLGNRPLDEFRDALDRHIGEARLMAERDREASKAGATGSLDAWNNLGRDVHAPAVDAHSQARVTGDRE